MSLDIGGDFSEVADGLQAVTLRSAGSSASLAVPQALRRAVSIREAAASGGRYTASDVSWHLPADVVAARPALGSTVIDSDGSIWTILAVDHQTLGSRWRCIARELAVALRLDTVVSIERASVTQSPAGAAHYDWQVLLAGVRARIQPRSQEHIVHNDLRAAKALFDIHVAQQVALEGIHRVIAADGAVYQVIGHEAAERIDQLMVIHAVRSAWPLG